MKACGTTGLLGCTCIFFPAILNHLGGKINRGGNNGILGSLFFEHSNTPIQFFVETILCPSTGNVLTGKGSVLRT